MSFSHHLLAAAILGCALAVPSSHVRAGSSASSAASDSVSVSVGSLSGSVKQSSDSITPDRKVADGDYRIVRTALLAGTPARVQLHLQPVGSDGTLARLRAHAAARAGAAPGRSGGGGHHRRTQPAVRHRVQRRCAACAVLSRAPGRLVRRAAQHGSEALIAAGARASSRGRRIAALLLQLPAARRRHSSTCARARPTWTQRRRTACCVSARS